MQLDEIRKEKNKQFTFKNIAPLKKMVDELVQNKLNKIVFCDVIKIDGKFDIEIYNVAKSLMPWRKGPFQIGDIFIDSEWQSFIKYNMLQKHFNLKDKVVADVVCNNVYYMFRMLLQ